MQLFVTDVNPKICAGHLDDLRLNKIIIESAQLLSTSHPELIDNPYKITHINHPLVKWIQKDFNHFYWTIDYFKALCSERKNRFPDKCIHKTDSRFSNIKSGEWSLDESAFYNCTPYKELTTFEAYKRLLLDKWKVSKTKPRWAGRHRKDYLSILSNIN